MGLIDFIFGFGFILFALLVLYYSFVKMKGRCAGCNSECNFRYKKRQKVID